MAWFSVLALALCALVVSSAAGVRGGETKTKSSFIIAAAVLAAAAVVLFQFGPGAGVAKVLAVGLPGLGGLVCYWAVRGHVAASRGSAAVFAAILGFALCGVAFVAQFGDRGLIESWARLGAVTGGEGLQIETQLARLADRERDLVRKLETGIPEFRRQLLADVEQVKADLQDASAATRAGLEGEMKEVARVLLALEKEEAALGDLLVRLRSEQRRLTRLRGTRDNLADNQDLVGELDQIWLEAGTRLSQPLDERLGTGVIEDAAVEQRLREILDN